MDWAKVALVEEFVRRSQGTAAESLVDSQIQDRIGIPFSDYSAHDDLFLLQLERYLCRLEAYRGEVKDSSAAVIPVRHPLFSVIAEWLDKQILWAGKLTENERREPANAWRLRQFETRLGLLPGSFGPRLSAAI